MTAMKNLIPALFLMFSITLVSCHKRGNSSDPPDMAVPVSTMDVQKSSAVFYDSYPGNTVPLKEVEVRGQVSGYITGIFFIEGTRISAGAKLYEVDRRQYEAALEEAKNSVKMAEANLANIQRDVDRYTTLSKQEAISKQQLDHSLKDLEDAKLQVASARQALIRAQTNYDYSLIRAPFDGTIGISQVRLGALVTPGQTLLNTISSDDPMAVDFEINEKELSRYQKLESAKISPGDTIFRVILPDNTVYPYPGRFSIIDRAVDPQTGTVTVRLVFPNPERKLRPGMSCLVRVKNENAGPQVIIPFKAVAEQMGEYFVFRVDGDKVKQSKVTIGQRIGPDLIIRSGLDAGEKIVVDGIGKLRDGTSITTAGSMPLKNYQSNK
jgi:membrane fusion protein, multidrug efflux system